MKKVIMFLSVLGLSFLLVACGNSDDNSKDSKGKDSNSNNNQEENAVKNEDNAPKEIVVSDEEKVEDEKVVIKVNDSEITGDEYNFLYLQAKTDLSQNGQDTEDLEVVKEYAIDSLVEQELIRQSGESAGIEVSSEDVEKVLEQSKEEDEAGLDAFLKQYNLTEATYKKRLLTSMVVQEYLETKIEVAAVTDEEIEEAYEKFKEDDSDIPELDQVRDQIEQILMNQHQAEQIQIKVKELKDTAKIEELI